MNIKPKRTNFVSIQNSHTISAEGYRQSPVRTGYEYILPNRTDEMFAYTAKQSGKVLSISNSGIIIEYKDGTQAGVNLGRVFGKAEGSVYPHDIVTPLKEGDKFDKGDIVVYNTGFFEPDFFNPKLVVPKNSIITKVALFEANSTFEDSSSISKEVSEKLTSKTTKIKSIKVGFNQNIRDIVKVGQQLNPKDLLLLVEDEITSNKNFNEESISILKKYGNYAPMSKYFALVDKIEVFYHGSKEDMSASLKAIADKSDKVLYENCKAKNIKPITGQVDGEYRVSGTPLNLDQAEIKIYLTISTNAGVGD